MREESHTSSGGLVHFTEPLLSLRFFSFFLSTQSVRTPLAVMADEDKCGFHEGDAHTACQCHTVSAYTQSLDELEFMRGACALRALCCARDVSQRPVGCRDVWRHDTHDGCAGTQVVWCERERRGGLHVRAARACRWFSRTRSALHYAARSGRLEACKLLLRRGAHVNAVTKAVRGARACTCALTESWQGEATALHRAAFCGHDEIVALLLKSGADAKAADDDKYVAVQDGVRVV